MFDPDPQEKKAAPRASAPKPSQEDERKLRDALRAEPLPMEAGLVAGNASKLQGEIGSGIAKISNLSNDERTKLAGAVVAASVNLMSLDGARKSANPSVLATFPAPLAGC